MGWFEIKNNKDLSPSFGVSKEVVVRINSEDENEIARFNELMAKYASGNTGN